MEKIKKFNSFDLEVKVERLKEFYQSIKDRYVEPILDVLEDKTLTDVYLTKALVMVKLKGFGSYGYDVLEYIKTEEIWKYLLKDE